MIIYRFKFLKIREIPPEEIKGSAGLGKRMTFRLYHNGINQTEGSRHVVNDRTHASVSYTRVSRESVTCCLSYIQKTALIASIFKKK